MALFNTQNPDGSSPLDFVGGFDDPYARRGAPTPDGWTQAWWGDGSWMWNGGERPLNTPSDTSNASIMGKNVLKSQLDDSWNALPAAERAALEAAGFNLDEFGMANGGGVSPGNVDNYLQWQKQVDNIKANADDGGWGAIMSNAFSSPLFQIGAIPFAASGLGNLLGGGTGASSGFGSGFIDAIGSGIGAGGSITGALPAVGGSMDWIDVLGDFTGSNSGGLSASDISSLMDMNSGASATTPTTVSNWIQQTLGIDPASSIGKQLVSSVLGGGSGSGGGNSLLGTLLGGLLGSTSGSKQAGTTTVTQEPWSGQQPYLLDAFNKAKQAANGSPLQTQANSNYSSVLSGPTKNPMLGLDNPYLTKAIDYANEDVTRAMMPAMNQANKAAGSFGNSGVADTYSNALTNQYGKNATGMRMTDYTNQQNLQQQAVNNTLGFTSNANNYAAQPSQNYAQTVQGNYGGQTTTPYYTNPLSGIMGGAMVGNQIGSNLGF